MLGFFGGSERGVLEELFRHDCLIFLGGLIGSLYIVFCLGDGGGAGRERPHAERGFLLFGFRLRASDVDVDRYRDFGIPAPDEFPTS